MIADAEFDTLLGDLYGGIVEPDRLLRFIGRLGEATGSHVGTLLRQDLANPSAATAHVVGLDRDSALRYEAEFAAENIWVQRSRPHIRRGATLISDDWVSKGELLRTRYYNDYLRTIDTTHSVGLCADAREQRVVMLTLTRSGRMGPYGADDRILFGRITPHFVNAYALMAQLEHLQAQLAQAAHSARALFLLDEHLHWVGGNDAAEMMVAAGWWHGRRGTRLDSPSAATRAAWQAAGRIVAKGGFCEGAIPVYDGTARLVAFGRIHPYGVSGRDAGLPCHVLFVRPLQMPDETALESQLRQLFGLTRGEAALVLALRSHGDLGMAAQSAGIAESSARTRLQVIFEKTAMHRQAELLQMLEALSDTLH